MTTAPKPNPLRTVGGLRKALEAFPDEWHITSRAIVGAHVFDFPIEVLEHLTSDDGDGIEYDDDPFANYVALIPDLFRDECVENLLAPLRTAQSVIDSVRDVYDRGHGFFHYVQHEDGRITAEVIDPARVILLDEEHDA